MQQKKCRCGRSSTGLCDGSHLELSPQCRCGKSKIGICDKDHPKTECDIEYDTIQKQNKKDIKEFIMSPKFMDFEEWNNKYKDLFKNSNMTTHSKNQLYINLRNSK